MVSHDEAFVNQLLTGTLSGITPGGGAGSSSSSRRDPSQPPGELWILEDQRFQRFEGTFREYKKKVLRAMQKDLKY